MRVFSHPDGAFSEGFSLSFLCTIICGLKGIFSDKVCMDLETWNEVLATHCSEKINMLRGNEWSETLNTDCVKGPTCWGSPHCLLPQGSLMALLGLPIIVKSHHSPHTVVFVCGLWGFQFEPYKVKLFFVLLWKKVGPVWAWVFHWGPKDYFLLLHHQTISPLGVVEG